MGIFVSNSIPLHSASPGLRISASLSWHPHIRFDKHMKPLAEWFAAKGGSQAFDWVNLAKGVLCHAQALSCMLISPLTDSGAAWRSLHPSFAHASHSLYCIDRSRLSSKGEHLLALGSSVKPTIYPTLKQQIAEWYIFNKKAGLGLGFHQHRAICHDTRARFDLVFILSHNGSQGTHRNGRGNKSL